MSMDAGGLAQMTYQSPFHNTIGVSGPGFATRGKASHIKRLSVAPPPQISTINETEPINIGSTPRTSRGHLLAGLRTAPKSATVPSANSGFGLEGSKYAAPQYNNARGPQTATGAFFPASGHGNSASLNQQMYSLPEHVLAPPSIDIQAGQGDQKYYDELVATSAQLAQQQRVLQQQLLNVTVAAQQFGGLNLSPPIMDHNQGFQSPVGSPMSWYGQQFSQGLQPIVTAVPNSPGVFAVYNPMTRQSGYIYDNNMPQHEMTPPESAWSPSGSRSNTRSPPKSTPSPPQDVARLPSPSANAFRRGHNKSTSSVNGNKAPGQNRTGEHPIRQPRGPPLLQELEEKPTSKFEGSKNFAIRQRRRAVHDLVRAGFVRSGF